MIFFVEEKWIIWKVFSIRRKMKTNESIILFEEKIKLNEDKMFFEEKSQ